MLKFYDLFLMVCYVEDLCCFYMMVCYGDVISDIDLLLFV